jgi:hypothetical protein
MSHLLLQLNFNITSSLSSFLPLPESEKGARDMEGFLKEVTEKGFIRKTCAVVPFGDLEVMETDRVREVLSPQLSAEDGRGVFCYDVT